MRRAENPSLPNDCGSKCDSVAGWSPRAKVGAFLIVLATLAAYLPAMNAGFIWDDDDYVTQSEVLRSGAGLAQIWFEPLSIPQYYPLVHTSFWIEHALWGLNPAGYHIDNILLHATAALLLWRVLKRLSLHGAWVVACLFAVHPVHVESVAWVTERKNVLSLVFYLASMLMYFRFDAPTETETTGEARNWRLYAASLAFFICAMLSKTVACSLPAAIVLILWWKRGRVTRRDWLRLAPMFVIGLALGLTTAWIEKNHVGAGGNEWSLTFAQRILIAGRAVWFYASKLVWPSELTFIYPRWEVDAAILWQWAFPLAAAAVVATLFVMRNRWGRGPLVAALLFCGTLLPALGFIDVYPMRYSFVADHFQYAASIAIIATVVTVVARIVPRNLHQLAGCAFTLLLASLTFNQSRIYHDQGTLWRDTLAKNPRCWMAEVNLAVFMHDNGDPAGAIEHAKRSIVIKPDHAEAYNTLGVVVGKLGRTREAESYYATSLRYKPHLVSAQMNLGVLLARTGRQAEAIGHFRTAAELSPRNIDAVYNWATASFELKKLEDAERLYARTLELAPSHAASHLHLGEILRGQNRLPEAEQHFRDAVRFSPDDPRGYNALATLLAASRDSAAIDPAQRACELTGWKNAELIGNLAFACAASGHTGEAALAADRAVQVAHAAGDTKLADEIAAWRKSLTSAEASIDVHEAAPR